MTTITMMMEMMMLALMMVMMMLALMMVMRYCRIGRRRSGTSLLWENMTMMISVIMT